MTLVTGFTCCDRQEARTTERFTENWRFSTGDFEEAHRPEFNDSSWRLLNLPHDWSIEGKFDENHPATVGGGALPGGIGWYRKSFTLDAEDSTGMVFIDFDGVYMDSKVWINGHLLGNRPNGYISFRYDLTPYLHFGDSENVIAVRVDNSLQPNSRWYSGSGIYRNVWLVKTGRVHIGHWGTFVTTPEVSEKHAGVHIQTEVMNQYPDAQIVQLKTSLLDEDGNSIASTENREQIDAKGEMTFSQRLSIENPLLWSVDRPYLYKVLSEVIIDGKEVDRYHTPLGVRYFEFDTEKGFLLNGEQVKIKGVCNHHDLGCLGAAVNTRALERQLEILKTMGCNAIRTAHNPPAPELLTLCDQMGFIVMDEVFDMWKKPKTKYDYSRFWDEWHQRDLVDFMKRDRNHPSVFIWSIGNEILEQWDSTGMRMVVDLYDLARSVDSTRPITTANNPPTPENNLNKPMVLDLIGYNYAHQSYDSHRQMFPGVPFIATETSSALASRGHYDMPSDSIRRWPKAWDIPFTDGNPDHTVSAYDHVSAPWGSTHEETWNIIRKNDYMSGMFVWTGFDYLGEPTPYLWPSRSSFFGIVDLAGFPKDSYYMYQSEWTDDPVVHVFPHWNWSIGDTVDIWAYFNTGEVELFLNGTSLGVKSKEGDDLHAMWRIAYEPGTLKAVARDAGKEVLVRTIQTAGKPASINLVPDRTQLSADGRDLAFITVEITDEDGNLVPDADHLVHFDLEGDAKIAGVDNGNQNSHEPFQANYRKAFHGKCLVVVQTGTQGGTLALTASSDGLTGARVELVSE